MSNPQKVKGTQWENDFVDLLNDNIYGAVAKRVAGSGAIGTIMGEPLLQGDIKATFEGVPQPFRIEAKVGYGGSKQMTIKKEWLDKIKEEASNSYSIPALACKFSGARKSSGVQYMVVLDFDTFVEIMNLIYNMNESLEE
jgi:hypothetical protein